MVVGTDRSPHTDDEDDEEAEDIVKFVFDARTSSGKSRREDFEIRASTSYKDFMTIAGQAMGYEEGAPDLLFHLSNQAKKTSKKLTKTTYKGVIEKVVSNNAVKYNKNGTRTARQPNALSIMLIDDRPPEVRPTHYNSSVDYRSRIPQEKKSTLKSRSRVGAGGDEHPERAWHPSDEERAKLTVKELEVYWTCKYHPDSQCTPKDPLNGKKSTQTHCTKLLPPNLKSWACAIVSQIVNLSFCD